jgi:hypothetical protein
MGRAPKVVKTATLALAWNVFSAGIDEGRVTDTLKAWNLWGFLTILNGTSTAAR